jgi:hypothetical protein
MIVQWCLKGVASSKSFGDAQALLALSRDGLTANWVRANATLSFDQALRDAHAVLSDAALTAHVNAYATVSAKTPYLSLSAGVIERDPTTRIAIIHHAWRTALDFATRGGSQEGFVFECWVQLPTKPAPELPGFGEEVRDLNLHRRFAWWHDQGEIAAKLVVPPRQIRRVMKFTPSLKRIPLPGSWNQQFVPPERISNIRRFL